MTITATIEAIDRSARLITFKGPQGNLATVYADENVKRFGELKVGDKVTASYYESIAVHVRKPGEPAPPPASAAVTPGKGAPGATAAVQETVTVTVQSIDRANQAVTVKRQDGGIVSFRVQNPKYLEHRASAPIEGATNGAVLRASGVMQVRQRPNESAGPTSLPAQNGNSIGLSRYRRSKPFTIV